MTDSWSPSAMVTFAPRRLLQKQALAVASRVAEYDKWLNRHFPPELHIEIAPAGVPPNTGKRLRKSDKLEALLTTGDRVARVQQRWGVPFFPQLKLNTLIFALRNRIMPRRIEKLATKLDTLG